MKSSKGFRVVFGTLCVLPFQACSSTEVDYFTSAGGAGGQLLPSAGIGGNDSSFAGMAEAGFGATVGDAGAGGVSGEAGEAGEAGAIGSSGAAGIGNGGMSSAGAGHAGQGGIGGGAGHAGAGAGNAGRGGGGGTGGDATGGSAGRGGGGASGAGAGAGGGGAGGASAVCGNSVLEKGEQCDDGNNKSLDACDASCAFEQSQRANAFQFEFATGSLCPRNVFGAAFARSARTVLQANLRERIADGSLSLLFAFGGLRDLTGRSAESISLGAVYGAPAVAPNYDGTSDRDWWYTPAADQVDDSGALSTSLSATLSGGVLRVNTGSIQLPLLGELPVNLSSIKLRLNIGDSSTPRASSGASPGHLAREHLSPSLVSFASGGQRVNGDPGELCGNLSAASLSALPIPPAYASGGSTPCSQDYAPTRSFLDLLVSGCFISSSGRVIAATQPDQADPGAPQGGDGAPYRFTTNASSHAVTGCRDKNNATVPLTTCLKAAAFSSAYIFRTGRVIIK